ncbi:hypothetical protein [Rhodococcoides fascians]|uniref:hypothetical protein n=1 Tax=Rhodococcoides fascians TaxID=1828 RepID=UPI0027836A0B|nr:hypothetical protein [Rhodococcus fascians]MDQ0284460.1 hypothetical protein [Rhodococcus fascians]
MVEAAAEHFVYHANLVALAELGGFIPADMLRHRCHNRELAVDGQAPDDARETFDQHLNRPINEILLPTSFVELR